MNNSRHLVVGDGVIGCAVADELARRGIPYALASRTPPGNVARADGHRCVDALDIDSLIAASADASHLYLTLGLPYTRQVWKRDWPVVIENAIAASKAHNLRLAFFDNVYPYGPTPLQVPMLEDHPQLPTSQKGVIRKALDERLWRAAREDNLPVVIGRAADFYGPGAHNTMLYSTGIARQLLGKPARWIGSPDRLHSYTYTIDAARGLVELALDDNAYGEVWHLPTAGPAPTTRTLLEHSASLLGAPKKIDVLPTPVVAVLKLFMPALREVGEMLYQNNDDYVFSSAKFMARYPQFPVTPYEAGMIAMARSVRGHAPETTQR